ncbi:unnamed protein product [Rhizophagus irregularis]|nr:unnamed protein product [Rhizophagus irregularis]CAB4488043.1 unnamed protein product [Rhizophagus irregularis]
MEENISYQQGNKFTPKELKDCPECGGFSSVYSALWMEGPRWIWDDGAQEWTRAGPMNVALKRLDNSQNISSSYINQIKAYHKCLQSASLAGTFGEWIILICDDPNPSKISDENSIAEEKRWKMISKLNNRLTHPEVHPEAYYTSRPLYFPELSNMKCYSNYREIR